MCYQHDGDGKCEDFEEKTSIKDCGFYTPEGFEDQWAISVTVNPHYNQSECSEDVIVGPPARDLVSKLIPRQTYQRYLLRKAGVYHQICPTRNQIKAAHCDNRSYSYLCQLTSVKNKESAAQITNILLLITTFCQQCPALGSHQRKPTRGKALEFFFFLSFFVLRFALAIPLTDSTLGVPVTLIEMVIFGLR